MKKLSLTKETLLSLSAKESADIQGGILLVPTALCTKYVGCVPNTMKAPCIPHSVLLAC